MTVNHSSAGLLVDARTHGTVTHATIILLTFTHRLREDAVYVLLVHLHEENRRIVFKIGQNGSARTLRRSFNERDDVLSMWRTDECTAFAVDRHSVMGGPFSIYSALLVRTVDFHDAGLPSGKFGVLRMLVGDWMCFGLFGRGSVSFVEGFGGSVRLSDIDGDVESVYILIGVGCAPDDAF